MSTNVVQVNKLFCDLSGLRIFVNFTGKFEVFLWGVWRVDFSGGGAGRLDLSRNMREREWGRYEKITVRADIKNSFIVKVIILVISSNYIELLNNE